MRWVAPLFFMTSYLLLVFIELKVLKKQTVGVNMKYQLKNLVVPLLFVVFMTFAIVECSVTKNNNNPFGLLLFPGSSSSSSSTSSTSSSTSSSSSGGPMATRVYGQGGNFTTGAINNGGISENSLCWPQKLSSRFNGCLYS